MANKEEYDIKEEIEKEFPKDLYEWIDIADTEEAHQWIAERMFNSPVADVMFFEARWFGPECGVLLIRKQKESNYKLGKVIYPETVRRFPFWKSLIIILLGIVWIGCLIGIFFLTNHHK